MTEQILINQILNNNKKAIRLFYDTYKPKLARFLKKSIKNSHDSEEVLQDVFVAALLSLPNFSQKSTLFTWLCSIARHETVDYFRKKKIKTIVFSAFPFLEKLVSRALGPELAYQEIEMKQQIAKTFKNLSEGYCQILRLKYIEEKTIKEIAKELGKSLKATESLLFRARIAFQKEYGHKFTAGEKNRKIFSSALNQGELSSLP